MSEESPSPSPNAFVYFRRQESSCVREVKVFFEEDQVLLGSGCVLT